MLMLANLNYYIKIKVINLLGDQLNSYAYAARGQATITALLTVSMFYL